MRQYRGFMKPGTGKERNSRQRIGTVFGPNDRMKILAKAGRDDQRNALVWVFCRSCFKLKTVRWANLNRNTSCGCVRDENVRQHAETAIARVPWPLKLQIWAAAQGKSGTASVWEQFADDLRPYKLQKHERDQLILMTRTGLVQIEKRIRESHWRDFVAALRDVIENRLDGRRRPGELTNKEYHRKKTGEIVGWYADKIRFAQEILKQWGAITEVNDPDLDRILLRAGFHFLLYVDLAIWLCRLVEHTQACRNARSGGYKEKLASQRRFDRSSAPGPQSCSSQGPVPDQDLIDASWSLPSADVSD